MEPNNPTPLFPQPTLFSSAYMSNLRDNPTGATDSCSLEPGSQTAGTESKAPGSSNNDLFQASGTTPTAFNFNQLPPLSLGQSSLVKFGPQSAIKCEFSEPSGILTRFETANPRILSVASPFSSFSPSTSTVFNPFALTTLTPFTPTAFNHFAAPSQANALIKIESDGSNALPTISKGTLQLPKPCLKFDQNGDLQLCVGTNDAKKEMLVDSRALCRASPILRKKLAETKSQGGYWHLKFPADQAEAFSILMDMVHGQFILTPKVPSIDQLYQVVVLANKYDMFQTLRPMASRWSAYDISKCTDFNDTTKLLFVAWHMGNVHFFKRIIESITENACVDRDGNLVVGPSCPERIENYTGIDVVESIISKSQPVGNTLGDPTNLFQPQFKSIEYTD